MEIAGFDRFGYRVYHSRYSPTLLVTGERCVANIITESAQEPRLVAYVSNDPNMIKAFKDGKDIYASIASIAFKVPYEKCLEFHPETGEYQPDGKARRGEAKTIVLGGPSVRCPLT